MTLETIIKLFHKASASKLYYTDPEAAQRVAQMIADAEREEIMDEWWMCVQSDLENGVKSLNERASEKWHKEYPAIAGFDATIRARKDNT